MTALAPGPSTLSRPANPLADVAEPWVGGITQEQTGAAENVSGAVFLRSHASHVYNQMDRHVELSGWMHAQRMNYVSSHARRRKSIELSIFLKILRKTGERIPFRLLRSWLGPW